MENFDNKNMLISICGDRACGKTVKLLRYASEIGCTIVTINPCIPDVVKKELGIESCVKIISYQEFLHNIPVSRSVVRGVFAVDDLDCFLDMVYGLEPMETCYVLNELSKRMVICTYTEETDYIQSFMRNRDMGI